MGSILFIIFVVTLFINIPIAVCLGIASVAALLVGGISIMAVPQAMFTAVNSFSLMAIPFFVLAGNVMASGGISRRLVTFSNLLIGGIRGGLALASILASMIFAAISGSSPATTAAIGSIMIPEMKKNGYDVDFAAATVAAAGTVGQVIPPSVPMVTYCVLAGCSVGKLFLAGIGPGLLMGLSMMVIAYRYAIRHNIIVKKEKKSRKEIIHIFIDSLWAILMPVIILGGIYSGIFTPTESAAVAVVYGVIVGKFIYKDLDIKSLVKILATSAAGTAVIMLIMATAGSFSWVLTSQRIPQLIASTLLGLTTNKFILLFLFNIVLLIAGCFLNPSAAVILLTPILLPVLTQVGVSPYLVGIIMIVNLAVGQVTPPVGSCLYVACNIAHIKLEPLVKAIVPYIVILILVILAITYVEPISLLLPNLLG
ncbi:TRAP transporter large permease [Sphaerochaeta sp.]|uniref:TRAP transporter large permease n=1 Tax=Sphaerochaeta sp. TaxID=1972642 RepID=UPI002FCB00E2